MIGSWCPQTLFGEIFISVLFRNPWVFISGLVKCSLRFFLPNIEHVQVFDFSLLHIDKKSVSDFSSVDFQVSGAQIHHCMRSLASTKVTFTLSFCSLT
jgi:hypothetical protein